MSLEDALRLFSSEQLRQEQLSALQNVLPAGVNFDDDKWDVLSWERMRHSKKVFHVPFHCIHNTQLRAAAKVYVLYQRLTKRNLGSSALHFVYALRFLDQVIPPGLPVQNLSNSAFLQAQACILDQLGEESMRGYGAAGALQAFGLFLQLHANLPITFLCGLARPSHAGQDGTAAGRNERLIPTEIIRDLLAIRSQPGLPLKDELCLHMLLVLVATGFRHSELLTLRSDCVHEENSTLSLRYFSAKRGRMDLKPVAGGLASAVKAAISRLREITEPGRQAAHAHHVMEMRNESALDWRRILADEKATAYFIGRFLHRWTAEPQHQLINPQGAWWDQRRIYVDILSMLQEEQGNISAVARRLGTSYEKVRHLVAMQRAAMKGRLPVQAITGEPVTSFHKDSRVVTISAVMRNLQISGSCTHIYPLVKEAAAHQLNGTVFPEPDFDFAFEQTYQFESKGMVYDQDNQKILEPWDALFVIEDRTLTKKGLLTQKGYKTVTQETLIKALRGKSGGQQVEESLFQRYDIRDPRTGEIAALTSTHLRQWLNTMYLRGGLTHEQAALVMGHDPGINAQYDQRDYFERELQLQQSVRDGHAVGHVADLYISLADHDLQEAEAFLIASLRQYSLMPHGACVRNLKLDPCPNHLACFADYSTAQADVCTHLVVDSQHPQVIEHLNALSRQQELMLSMLPATSPQRGHAVLVHRNIQHILAALPQSEAGREE